MLLRDITDYERKFNKLPIHGVKEVYTSQVGTLEKGKKSFCRCIYVLYEDAYDGKIRKLEIPLFAKDKKNLSIKFMKHTFDNVSNYTKLPIVYTYNEKVDKENQDS